MFTKKTHRTKAEIKTAVGLSAEIYDILTELAEFIFWYTCWFAGLFVVGYFYYWIIKLVLGTIGVGI